MSRGVRAGLPGASRSGPRRLENARWSKGLIVKAASDGVATAGGTPVGVSRVRWVMIGLVFLATLINYLDRQTLSVAAPVIIEQFHLSNVEYSPHHLRVHAGVHGHERASRGRW